MSKGHYYEAIAARHVQRAGLQVLQHNFRCRVGEIDLVCRDGDCLVFIEVRYRTHRSHAGALGSVTRAKQLRILRSAQVFLQRRGLLSGARCRFDVIAITPGAGGAADEIQWLRHAFTL